MLVRRCATQTIYPGPATDHRTEMMASKEIRRLRPRPRHGCQAEGLGFGGKVLILANQPRAPSLLRAVAAAVDEARCATFERVVAGLSIGNQSLPLGAE